MDLGVSEAAEHSSQGLLGKSHFYRALEEATQKQGMIGYEGGGFLIRPAGPIV